MVLHSDISGLFYSAFPPLLLLSYAGHVLRADGSLEKDIGLLTGRMDGSRRKGRPRMNYWDKLKELSRLRPDEIADVARDRGRRSAVV